MAGLHNFYREGFICISISFDARTKFLDRVVKKSVLCYTV